MCVCTSKGGGYLLLSISPFFLFPYLIPLSLLGRGVERVMAVAGGKGTEKS